MALAFLHGQAIAFDRLGSGAVVGTVGTRFNTPTTSSPTSAHTRGLPLLLSDDGKTLVQAGGLPIPTSTACKDPRLASRNLVTDVDSSSSGPLALSTYCTQTHNATDSGTLSAATSRIVGGTRSNGSRYPYLALVFDSEQPYCQGFLIAPRWIVTAAHCVDDSMVGVKIGADQWMIDDIVGHKYVPAKVKKQIMHEQYESHFLRPGNKNMAPPSDIALLQLATPITSIPPVKLATKAQAAKLPKVYTVIGFGRTGEFEADMSRVLRETTVNNVDRKKCQDAFNKEIKKNGYWSKGAPTYTIGPGIICAGDNISKKRDACQGDSGGPLIAKGKTSSDDVVYGITSFGEGCGRKGLSGGYTNVGYFDEWIQSTIKKNGGP